MPVLGIITATFLVMCYTMWVMREYAKRRKEKVKKLRDKLRRLDEAVAVAATVKEENMRLKELGVSDNWESDWYWPDDDCTDPSVPGSIYDTMRDIYGEDNEWGY